jgi:dihydroflavonol-4-reductase
VDFLNGKIPGYVETGELCRREGAPQCTLLAERQIGERYLLGAENLTLKQVLDALAHLTACPRRIQNSSWSGLGAPGQRRLFQLIGREPQIPSKA